MAAEGNVGTFVSKNPLAERIGSSSAMQGFLEAIAVRYFQRVEASGLDVAWPHMRFETNNAMTMIANGLAFVVALEDTEVPIKEENISLMARHDVQISVHPPEFQNLVFRTGARSMELQQQVSGLIEALLEVCLFMVLGSRARVSRVRAVLRLA